MKILLLDIETAPNLAYVWGMWEQNVSPEMLVEEKKILCWSAKWLGGDEIVTKGGPGCEETRMLSSLAYLLSEADVVVHYNGRKFDIPYINKAFLDNNILPPSPYKQIDLLQTVRSQFKFNSNRLGEVCKSLGLGGKAKHSGFQTWLGCIEGSEKDWDDMIRYNREDVFLLERLYYKLRPWIKGHPNANAYDNNGQHLCPNCGSAHVQKRGTAYTQGGRYQRYHCQSCGMWSRGVKGEIIKNRLVGIV